MSLIEINHTLNGFAIQLKPRAPIGRKETYNSFRSLDYVE